MLASMKCKLCDCTVHIHFVAKVHAQQNMLNVFPTSNNICKYTSIQFTAEDYSNVSLNLDHAWIKSDVQINTQFLWPRHYIKFQTNYVWKSRKFDELWCLLCGHPVLVLIMDPSVRLVLLKCLNSSSERGNALKIQTERVITEYYLMHRASVMNINNIIWILFFILCWCVKHCVHVTSGQRNHQPN